MTRKTSLIIIGLVISLIAMPALAQRRERGRSERQLAITGKNTYLWLLSTTTTATSEGHAHIDHIEDPIFVTLEGDGTITNHFPYNDRGNVYTWQGTWTPIGAMTVSFKISGIGLSYGTGPCVTYYSGVMGADGNIRGTFNGTVSETKIVSMPPYDDVAVKVSCHFRGEFFIKVVSGITEDPTVPGMIAGLACSMITGAGEDTLAQVDGIVAEAVKLIRAAPTINQMRLLAARYRARLKGLKDAARLTIKGIEDRAKVFLKFMTKVNKKFKAAARQAKNQVRDTARHWLAVKIDNGVDWGKHTIRQAAASGKKQREKTDELHSTIEKWAQDFLKYLERKKKEKEELTDEEEQLLSIIKKLLEKVWFKTKLKHVLDKVRDICVREKTLASYLGNWKLLFDLKGSLDGLSEAEIAAEWYGRIIPAIRRPEDENGQGEQYDKERDAVRNIVKLVFRAMEELGSPPPEEEKEEYEDGIILLVLYHLCSISPANAKNKSQELSRVI